MSMLNRFSTRTKKKYPKVKDEEESSLHGDEFPSGESARNIRSQSSSELDEDVAAQKRTFRETLPPNGDLYYSATGGTGMESSSLLSLSEGPFYPSYTNVLDDNKASSCESYGSGVEFHDSNSKIVSFQDVGYYSSNEYYDSVPGDSSVEDDDISYDPEEPFELNDEVLDLLRSTDSPFSNPKRNVQYRDRDHFGIITQMYGSVWRHVIPFCIFNAVWCFVIDYCHDSEVSTPTPPSNSYQSQIVFKS